MFSFSDPLESVSGCWSFLSGYGNLIIGLNVILTARVFGWLCMSTVASVPGFVAGD
jgi:hypothetical protein